MLPLHHTYESTIILFFAPYCGCKVTFCEGFKYVLRSDGFGTAIRDIQLEWLGFERFAIQDATDNVRGLVGKLACVLRGLRGLHFDSPIWPSGLRARFGRVS